MSKQDITKKSKYVIRGSNPRVFIAIILASVLVVSGLAHASFAEVRVPGGNDKNTYSNLQFGIEKIELPNGWTRTIQEANSTAGTADEVTITLRLENATASSSGTGAPNPFSLFSSPASGNNNSSGIGNEGNNTNNGSSDPFSPTITIKLQKGDALKRQLAAERNQTTAGQQEQEMDLFTQNPYCKPVNSASDNGTVASSSNNTATTMTMINGHSFTKTEQECDVAPILKLFFGSFFANLANSTINQNNSNGSALAGNATNNGSGNANATGTNNNADAAKLAEALDSIHNIITTEKRYVYTSPSSNLRVEISYSALTFLSVQDFEIKAKQYQRYLPVFENMVHSIEIQQQIE